MSQQLDAQGEAHDALGAAVSSYGQRVLSDPLILGNLVTDLLPDLPRERSLLVTGAEVGIAAEMTQHVQEQHIDPDTAVQLVARTLSERRSIDPAASMWVATEYAKALGYRVRPYAEAAQSAQPQVIPAALPTMTALSGQPIPTMPPAQAPDMYAPQWQPAQNLQGAQMPHSQSWPPNAQMRQGLPGQSWPPAQPPSGRRPSSFSGRTRSLMAGGAAAGLVVIFLIVAAVAGITPFSKSHKAAALTPTHSRQTHRATPSPTPTRALAPGVTLLTQLVPGDIADPATQCSAIKPSWTSPGLITSLSCTDTGLPNGAVFGYQMDSRADYTTTWKKFNSWSSFNGFSAGSVCPPSGSDRQGLTPWWDNKLGFPQTQGQVLECWTGANAAPIYVWTMPTQDAFFMAVGADGSSFKALDSWWTANAAPAKAPTATPNPQSS